MGQILKAQCDNCGYQSGLLMAGAGRFSGETRFGAPARCYIERAVVTVNTRAGDQAGIEHDEQTLDSRPSGPGRMHLPELNRQWSREGTQDEPALDRYSSGTGPGDEYEYPEPMSLDEAGVGGYVRADERPSLQETLATIRDDFLAPEPISHPDFEDESRFGEVAGVREGARPETASPRHFQGDMEDDEAVWIDEEEASGGRGPEDLAPGEASRWSEDRSGEPTEDDTMIWTDAHEDEGGRRAGRAWPASAHSSGSGLIATPVEPRDTMPLMADPGSPPAFAGLPKAPPAGEQTYPCPNDGSPTTLYDIEGHALDEPQPCPRCGEPALTFSVEGRWD